MEQVVNNSLANPRRSDIRNQASQLRAALKMVDELQEEVKQLCASLQIYQELVERLTVKPNSSDRSKVLSMPRAS